MKTLPENALLGIVIVGFLAFVGIQGMSMLNSFLEPPEKEIPHGVHGSYDMTEEEYGLEVLKTAGCMGCHNLEIEVASDEGTQWQMQGGVLGPSLNNVAVRWQNSRENLTQKIVDPEATMPNSYMPSFAHLSEEDLHALVSFLLTLTGQRQPEVATVDPAPESSYTEAQIDSGRQVFQSQGCMACHTITTTDPPIVGGIQGPNLSYEGLRNRSDEWQKQHLRNPYSVYVLGGDPQIGVICGNFTSCMPSYSALSEQQLDDLVAFLQSLR